MHCYICRDMDDAIVGIFMKEEDAKISWRSHFPDAVFDGITVKSNFRQIGWLTGHYPSTVPCQLHLKLSSQTI